MSAPPFNPQAITSGKFHTVRKVSPVGSLQARRQSVGTLAFYWRYSQGMQSERVLIGIYDPSSPPKRLERTASGYSFQAAVRAAEALALEHHNYRDRGGRRALATEREEAAARQAEAEARAANATLAHLLLEYCDHQRSLGRESHRNARSIFQLHVIEAHPALAARPAADITVDECADLMRSLIRAGKRRTSNKLRSYARAAYQVALTARTKPIIPERFKEFGINVNPWALTAPDEAANKTDKNPLTLEQLRHYWSLIKDLAGFKGALLRLHLLTGGQRIEQLVRLKTSNIKADYFVLLDGKGRPRGGVRQHWIPLTRPVREALLQCKPAGTYALSTNGGDLHVAGTTLSGWADEIAQNEIVDFSAKRIRSGVETALAAANVPEYERGHLQSHGISGVQARHYDGHDYLEVKREALMLLHGLICGNPVARRAGPTIGRRKVRRPFLSAASAANN